MKRIVINLSEPTLRRAAVLEDGKLTDLLIEKSADPAYRGCVYLGRIVNYEKSLKAAFVDIGRKRHGFLPLAEIMPTLLDEKDKIPKRNQEVLVQVTREEVMQKGAMLTTYISLAGRYLVLMPQESGHNGISRKISDGAERQRLKNIQEAITPKSASTIMRTACENCSKSKLAEDLTFLKRLWAKMQQQVKKTKAPAVIYAEQDFVSKILREYFSQEMDDVIIDDLPSFKAGMEYFRCIYPRIAQKKLKLYQEKEPVFHHYQVEQQIAETFEPRVNLPSGGSIVIEQTEALVSIDVNSGKTREKNPPDTSLKTNIEAANEIARQLRLRDLGGIIVIDFIDMDTKANEQKVLNVMHEALTLDRARVHVGQFSANGTLELNRQRGNSKISTSLLQVCPHCNGTGHIWPSKLQAVAIMDRLKAYLAKAKTLGGVTAHNFFVESSSATALLLLNEYRADLLALEQEYNCSISLLPLSSFGGETDCGLTISIAYKR